MICIVYRLRHLGERLPTEEVRARGVEARLVYSRHPVYPTMRATLFDQATGASIGELECAQIKQIDAGVLVTGSEQHASQLGVRQTWWCVPR